MKGGNGERGGGGSATDTREEGGLLQVVGRRGCYCLARVCFLWEFFGCLFLGNDRPKQAFKIETETKTEFRSTSYFPPETKMKMSKTFFKSNYYVSKYAELLIN